MYDVIVVGAGPAGCTAAKALAEKAKESGAEGRDGVAAFSCTEKDGFVEVSLHGQKNDTEGARYVLDCEGVVGALKRQIARQYAWPYLQPELSEYDAWFNVKDGLLALGVYVKDMDKIGHYYGRFIAYMEEKHHLRIGRQTKEEKWLMPHIRPGCRVDYGVGRILFAGEVAGFLNPMGEGISAGMESGHCAASEVMEKAGTVWLIRKAVEKPIAGRIKQGRERR